MLILTVAEYLNELLKNCCLAAVTSLSKLRRVMVMTVDLTIVFVVAVLRSKYGRTHRAGEVVDVVFAIKGRNV